MNKRHICTGGAEVRGRLVNAGITLLRIVIGIIILCIGLQKIPPSAGFTAMVEEIGFPMPTFFAVVAGLLEVVGGILLIVGLFTRWGALFVMAVVATAFFTQHLDDPLMRQLPSLLVFFVALQYLFIGGGYFSLDQWIRSKNRGQ